MFSGLRTGLAVRCGVSHRCSLNLALLWLWRRPAAVALMRPLAWETLYAVDAALKRKKKKKKKKPGSLKMPQDSLWETGLMPGARLKATILIKTATQSHPFDNELLIP